MTVGSIVRHKHLNLLLVGLDPHCFGPLKYRLEFGPNDYRWVSEIS